MQPTPAPNSSTPTSPTLPADAAASPATTDSADHRRQTQWTLIASMILCFLAFWWAGDLISFPAERGFDGSLLRQPTLAGSLLALVALAVLTAGLTLLVEMVAGRFWLFAGPFAALAGLSAWSFRGGSIRSVLTSVGQGSATGLFVGLALEMLLLGLLMAGLWWIIYRRFHTPLSPKDPPFSLIPTGRTIQAVLTQSAFITLGLVLLVPSADKKQAVFGLLVACFAATAITDHIFKPTAAGHWCWMGPILVGIIGYLVNAFGADATVAIETGRLQGTFAALVRPLPLDYASAGVVGALLGLAMTTDHWEVVHTRQTSNS